MNSPEIIERALITLFQYGVAGVGLYWFAVRMERKMGSIDKAITRMTKTILIDIISSRSNSSPIVCDEARSMLNEIQAKTARDTKAPF